MQKWELTGRRSGVLHCRLRRSARKRRWVRLNPKKYFYCRLYWDWNHRGHQLARAAAMPSSMETESSIKEAPPTGLRANTSSTACVINVAKTVFTILSTPRGEASMHLSLLWESLKMDVVSFAVPWQHHHHGNRRGKASTC